MGVGDESASSRNAVCFGENKLSYVRVRMPNRGGGKGKGGQHDFLVNDLLVKPHADRFGNTYGKTTTLAVTQPTFG